MKHSVLALAGKVFKQLLAEKRTESMFQRIDVNGDGKVTLDEINAEAARRAQRHTGKHGH